ncbi:phosphatidylserine decarboxylase-domain-containing protein [Kalaharituber pfeilii]|nr:phosphatidylserine decarboxylase-domain-containing protein [Kalaharituber pfeilii]
MPVPPPPLRQQLARASRRALTTATSALLGTGRGGGAAAAAAPPGGTGSSTAVASGASTASSSSASTLKNRRLSSSKPSSPASNTPLLRGAPFLHRRPLFPLSPRTSRIFSSNSGGANSGAAGAEGKATGAGGSSSAGSPGAGGAGAGGKKRPRFGQRLREALSKTKIEWYPIPIGLGIAYLAYAQLRKKIARRKYDEKDQEEQHEAVVVEEKGRRKRIRPDGPWQVQVLSTLPLKAFSRAWGYFNEIELPVFLRTPGFKLYSWIFGVDLTEIAEPDLRAYRNLSEFFYRQLKEGVRPIDQTPGSLVSPADGTVLHFGEVRPGGHVEQVKGMTYSLDALIGAKTVDYDSYPVSPASSSGASTPSSSSTLSELTEAGVLDPDEEFAIVNGISYTLPSLLHGTDDPSIPHPKTTTQAQVRESIVQPLTGPHAPSQPPEDLSLPPSDPATPTTSDVAAVAKEVSMPWHTPDRNTKMYFCVIYLAPGDYHRFHSPVSWVVERRRHFAGELYSVSPYLQRTLPNLFTLNERVALLGRWRHGLFTMTPVGATNVGSIIINFDKELRTNTFSKETKAEKEGGYYEAVYRNASWLLGGQPVKKGAEMGGFKLGSTIVLVFEAPGGEGGEGERAWRWECKRGGKVKVGEKLGVVEGF